jgi:hypothetical protein
MRVGILNMTEHPFLIRHKTPFITAEFHLLSEVPLKPYAGAPGEPELTEDEINRILGRGEPWRKDMHRDLVQLQQTMKDAAILGKDMPRLVAL